MFKSLESLRRCAQPFSEFPRNKSTCYSSEVEIKAGDSLFWEKQRDNFTVCLFVKFWRFLHFRLERRLENRLATSPKEGFKVGLVIVLPRLREVDILHPQIVRILYS